MKSQPNFLLILNDDMGYPVRVAELKALYFAWAKRCNVMESDDLRALRQPKFRAEREARRAAGEKGAR